MHGIGQSRQERIYRSVQVIDLWAAACGFVLFFGIKKLHGLRVDKRIEEEGLDIHEHGEACYN